MMGRRCYVLLRCHYDVRIRRRRDVLLRLILSCRRSIETSLGASFETYLDVTGRYRETSLLGN